MKQIPNFPGYYATEDGRIWSSKTDKWLKPFLTNQYFRIGLYKNGSKRKHFVHRLVLETFTGKCPNSMETCHNNGIKTDNRIENLRWDTRKNNQRDRIKHGTNVYPEGENNVHSKLTEQDVRMIIYMYRTKEFTQTEIAELYNINRANVSLIINRKRWKYIWRK